MRKMKILVAEPDAGRREHLLKVLGPQDAIQLANPVRYELFEADSSATAIALFNTVFPDLVVISVQTDTKDGKMLCREIRTHESERHTGIVFLAASETEGDMLPVECLELGADDFFSVAISHREMIARINAVLRLKDMTDELRSANHRLELLSLTDELTGLHNMRSFNLQFNNYLKTCREGASGLGIIMIDLDHFKEINDTTNHLVGSHVISDVGKLIRLSGILSNKSCPARYGGDEYIICCLSDSVEDVIDKAERLRALLMSALFTKDGYSVRVTASVGVSWIDPGFDGKQEDPIKASDLMLYRSKKLGRNRVSAMILRYPIDFDHIGRPHLIERDSGSNDNGVPRANNF